MHIVIIFISSFLLAFLFLYWLKYEVAPAYWPIGVDIYPLWVGTRAFWNGQSPYTSTVDFTTLSLMYGRQPTASDAILGFYYPAYVAEVLAPFALLPVGLAALVWSALMYAILVSLIISITLSLPDRLSPFRWALLLLSGLLYRPALLAVLDAQYGLFIVACWALAWYTIRKQRWFLAGFLVAISTIKPSLSLIPAGVVILWSLYKGRPKIALSFFCTLVIMLAISFVKIGWWIPDFLLRIGEVERNATWVNSDILTVPGICWLLFCGYFIFQGFREFKATKEFPFSLFFGGLLLNLAITPHTLEYDMVVLILPLILLTPALGKTLPGYFYLLFIIFCPWISWMLFTLVGIPISTWWKALWQFYPLLITGTFIFLLRNSRPFDYMTQLSD